MNLQENIQRIKSMMGGINESVSDINSNLNISSKDDDVESLQDLLGIKKDDSQDKISSVDIIFMGGLDDRPGDLTLNQQTKRLKDKLPNKNIISFRYNNPTGVLAAIKKTPEAYVVLFSAGGKHSSATAKEITYKYKLFIVEPYNGKNGYSKSVNGAVSIGVPTSNVITGPSKARGMNIVLSSTKTPEGIDHWGALGYVTRFIK